MMHIYRAGTAEADARLREIRARRAGANEKIARSVREILADVREHGWEAVVRRSELYDGAPARELSRIEWDDAAALCPPAVSAALEKAAARIRDYQEKLLVASKEWRSPDGGRVGVLSRGLTTVGLYVPGGTAAYPSSVLMNAVPAKVAGVGTLLMVTPPTKHLSPAVLRAAQIAGVDRVFAVGGAQAVAALAFGAGMPRADKVVGPGNAYVAEAKRQLFGLLDIDMIAGPSEVLVIADETADPVFAAADLLSQAEHDKMAGVILLTTSETVARNVRAEIARQLMTLPRREIAEAAMVGFGALLVCEELEEAVALANELAPEHLELLTRDPDALLPSIRNAGAVFLGPYSPEPLGDYMAGPSHVLPTSGSARFFSPLSVDTFLKKTSVIGYERAHLAPIWRDIVTLAEAEGLDAHANSIKMRFRP